MSWKLVVLAALVCAVAGLLLMEERDEGLELTILHTNDLHAHYDVFGEPSEGGVARLKTLVDEIRDDEDDILFLDAGDQFQGTLFFHVGGAQVVADVMNELGYDAMVIGNHEFDSGPAELANFIGIADFPVLSANTDASADRDLAELILPYEVFDFDSAEIAVIGLTSEHTAAASSPGPDIRFLDVVTTAQQTVDELEKRGIDVVIALTHLGYERDLELARSVSGIDVIVGGHSHTLLEEHPIVTTSASGEPVLVVTAHEWGKYLGELHVSFTEDGRVQSYAGGLLSIDESIPEDRGMLRVLDAYRPAIGALMTRVVGTTDVDLNGTREDIRVRETNLGNLICDAMLWKTEQLGATIALQNGGGIRASIPVGEITMGQALEVLPYGNRISVLSLSGAELTDALENGVGQVEDGSGRFPHVGGMRYSFDPSAEPGTRIINVEIWDEASESFAPLDTTATVVLATNSFLADGGDGFEMLGLSSERYDTGWLLSDVLAEYLTAHPGVAADVEDRIMTEGGTP